LGRLIRWQAIVALAGLALLVALLASYLDYPSNPVIVPETGGVLVEGVVGNPRYINPLLSHYNRVDRDLCALIFNGLTEFTERGDIAPDLAERWEISADGLIYTFYLRSDVRWHDGVPFSAADVLYTVLAMQDLEFPGVPDLKELWTDVHVEQVDDYTVRFALSSPFAPFLDYTTIGILPSHLWSEIPSRLMPRSQLNVRPIGTGPFRLTELDAVHAVLEPSLHYTGQAPLLDAVEFRFQPDSQGAYAAYDAGEVDGVCHILSPGLGWAAGKDDLALYSAPLAGLNAIILNLDNPNVTHLQERAVRQALLYGIDRQAIVDEATGGDGLIAHSPIIPNTWAYNAEQRIYAFDPQLARQMLESAGWNDTDGDGVVEKSGQMLQFVLLGDDDPIRVRMLDMISADLAEIGISAVPQPVSFAGLVSDFLYPRRFEAALISWDLPGDPDPYPLWHSTQKEGGQNYGGWSNRRADETIEEARLTADPSERVALYREFQDIFVEELPALPLLHPVYTYGVRDNVQGVTIGRLNEPSDRFRSIASWYLETRALSVRELAERKILSP